MSNPFEIPVSDEQEGDDDEVVTLRMPAWAWDILLETLEMDTMSGAIDPQLRGEIDEALSYIEEV